MALVYDFFEGIGVLKWLIYMMILVENLKYKKDVKYVETCLRVNVLQQDIVGNIARDF